MSEEIKNNELTDEQLEQVTGGLKVEDDSKNVFSDVAKVEAYR